MSNKKHIDRLFQEKFKDFEVAPDPKVWNNIQNELTPQKEKKKVIPVWYKYAGVAAILLLSLTVGITTYNNVSNTTNAIVDTEIPAGNENLKNNNTTNATQNTISNTPLVSSPTNTSGEELNTNINSVKDVSTKNDVVVSAPTATTIVSNKNKTNTSALSTPLTTAVVSSRSYKTTKSNPVTNNSATPKTDNQAIAANTNSYSKNSTVSPTYEAQNNKTKATTSVNNTIANMNSNPINGVAVISNSNVQKTANQEDAINDAINAVRDDTFSIAQSPNKNGNETTANTVVKDSIAQTNAIENAIAETENNSEKEKQDKENSNNKWSVNANIAPVYYNTLSKGSHIDQQFINNEKSGDVNTSYGINVGYAINDKLKIRSGINSLNLGYNTNNVVVYKSVANSGRDPIALSNLEVSDLSTGDVGFTVVSGETISTNQFESILTEENIVSLKQQISYLEIPVELEYALVNKRFGVNVVGGMSTFVLGSNEVSTQLNGMPTQIGQANNINEISFSTNIGLGINYDFSKAFNLNLEPTFKYQLNAFEDTAGNFNPFLIGFYTGLSYKF